MPHGKSQDARESGRSFAEVALATPIYSSAGVVEGIGCPMCMRGWGFWVAMFCEKAYGSAFLKFATRKYASFAAAVGTHLDIIRKRLTMCNIADSVVGRDYTVSNPHNHIPCP